MKVTFFFTPTKVGFQLPYIGYVIQTQPLHMTQISNCLYAHIRYKEIKANFCGREKQGHFHYKNFLRALK